jgi:hypothetical protein
MGVHATFFVIKQSGNYINAYEKTQSPHSAPVLRHMP